MTSCDAMALILKALDATRPGVETMSGCDAMALILKALAATRPRRRT